MRDLFLLGSLRYRLLANTFLNMKKEGLYKFAFFFVLGVLFILGDYSFFYRVIEYLKGEEIIGPVIITQLLDMMSLTFFFMLFFSTIVAAISTMYLSSDLDLLISSPVRTTSIFTIKFAQTLINSSWMVLLFGIPMFCALGGVYRQGPEYYISMLALFFPYTVIPTGLGIMFTICLVRYFPAKRMQQVMTFMIVLFIAGLVIFFRFMKPEVLYTETGMKDDMIMTFFERLSVPRSPYLPSAWLTEGFMTMIQDNGETIMKPLLYLFSSATILFVVVITIAKYAYFKGLSEAGTTSSGGKGGSKDLIDSMVRMMPVPNQVKALLVKDIKVFLRDTGQWSQLFILGALVIVYIFNIKNLPLDTYYLKNLVAFLNLGLAGFVLASVSIRFVFPSVSLEGEAIWIIKRSPIGMSRFLWEKYFAFLFPLLFLGEVLMIGSNLLLEVDVFMMILSTASICLITLAITGLGIGLGAMFPRFKYENIAQVAAGAGGIIYMILCLAYIGVVIILEARPVYVHFKRQLFFGDYDMSGLYVYLTVIVFMTIATVIIPMKKGIRALEETDI